jgi:hypothetical protein
LLPGATATGEAEFVVTRSACVASATTSFAVALLLPGLGSLVEELTVAIWLMAVPAAVPAFTFTTKVKFAVELAPRVAIVQVSVPRLHVHPAGPVKD